MNSFSPMYKAFSLGLYTFTIRPFVDFVRWMLKENTRGVDAIFFLVFACVMNLTLMAIGTLSGYVLGEPQYLYWAFVPAVWISLVCAAFEIDLNVDKPTEA